MPKLNLLSVLDTVNKILKVMYIKMGDKIEDIIIIRVRCLCGLAIEFALTLLKLLYKEKGMEQKRNQTGMECFLY